MKNEEEILIEIRKMEGITWKLMSYLSDAGLKRIEERIGTLKWVLSQEEDLYD